MTLRTALLALAAASIAAAPALAQDAVTADPAEAGAEQAFVTCLMERDRAIATALRDAPSEEAFIEAFRGALEICPSDVEQMSMGRFFDALNVALDADDATDGANG